MQKYGWLARFAVQTRSLEDSVCPSSGSVFASQAKRGPAVVRKRSFSLRWWTAWLPSPARQRLFRSFDYYYRSARRALHCISLAGWL